MSAPPTTGILIVEDERIVAKDLQRTLIDMGYDAFAIASSAEEAFEIASVRWPDLVLMDILIKGREDGIRTAELLQCKHAVTIIYLTSHADDATLDRAKRTEPEGYLQKPIRPGDLKSMIEVARYKQQLEQVRARLRASEQRISTITENVPVSIGYFDCEGHVQFANRAFRELVSDRENLITISPNNSTGDLVDQEMYGHQQRALAGERVTFLMQCWRNGRNQMHEMTYIPEQDSQGTVLGVYSLGYNVTEREQAAKEISFRASHDELTGLRNRAEFEMRLRNALASSRQNEASHALLFIDLDQFKLVNDACGHAVGDKLLQQVAALFQHVIRSHDTLARLGGDEFGVIMENCTVAQARRVAGQLCKRMANFRFVHGGRRFLIGASVGLVPVDSRWIDMARLMHAADASCHAAKEAGRNCVHEWLDTDKRIKERLGETQWVSRLEEALDGNQFQLYGQQIASCRGPTAALSLEVFLRLPKSDNTMIAAAAFLPAAERFHMASRIDRWVVHELLDRMGQIPLQGVETIAINLSGQSIGDKSFHHYLIDRISHVPFDPRKLCFEITEMAAVTNLGEVGEFINAIRALGVRIALDDFGAGASSFGYLKHLTVDRLKIDGHLIQNMVDDPLDRTAVCCFRDVAKIYRLQTVAKFVETPEVLAEVRKIGLDFAQGFLIHRAEPLDHLLAALPKGRKLRSKITGTSGGTTIKTRSPP